MDNHSTVDKLAGPNVFFIKSFLPISYICTEYIYHSLLPDCHALQSLKEQKRHPVPPGLFEEQVGGTYVCPCRCSIDAIMPALVEHSEGY